MAKKYPFKTWKAAETAFSKINTCATETDFFIARCFPLLLKHLANADQKTASDELMTLFALVNFTELIVILLLIAFR